MRFVALFACFALAACSGAGPKPDPKEASMPKPPVAKKEPKDTTLHGDSRIDDYHWMREKKSPEVKAHLEAENAYAAAMMKPAEPLKEKLFAEIKGRIKQTDLSVPVRDHGYWYYSRTEDGKQYPLHCRKKGSLEAPEEVLLDLNAMAAGHKYLGLGGAEVSDDGHKLAYSADYTGFREYSLFVKDLETGKLEPEKIARVSSFAWAADNQTLFYVVDDHAKRPHKLFRHKLGEADDTLIFEEKDERFRLWVDRSRDRRWLIAGSGSQTTSEWKLLAAGSPIGEWVLVAPRVQDQEYTLEPVGDTLYIRTNDQGRNFRIVTATPGAPGREHWKELLPHDPTVMRTDFQVFRDKYVTREREGGLPYIRVGDLKTGQSKRVAMPEAVYSLYPYSNPEFDTGTYRYTYLSLVTPRSIFELDLTSLDSKLLKEKEVLGGYDRTAYKTERIQATAKDGVQVAISLVYKKTARPAGGGPLLLIGYGSYGFAYPVYFDSDRLSLLDRGVTFAIAHIRGGGEMGKAWHDQGRMMTKMNTFTDFIAAAEHLIAKGYTSPDKLAINGGSAGGLLMGAVVNLRPDLFRIAVLEVPFVDVLNTMSDEDIPLTVSEFEEWGNPRVKEQYDYIKSYCPYTNLAAQDYPTLLVRTSFEDSQVMYWEPAKYVAKLRAVRTDDDPLVFFTNMAGGHGGSSGRDDTYLEEAYKYAFILWHLGIRD